MMVQSAPEGEPHFISTMLEHMDFCGQMARSFGNDTFEPIAPAEALYAIDNHDRGWDNYDQHPGFDPNTRLPYLMAQTPADDAIKIHRGSPDYNEGHHPYSGLLASMHTWGLYNRRYGFSQFAIRTRTSISVPVSPENRKKIDTLLKNELERQKRLRAVLSSTTQAEVFNDEEALLQNYKQLQFIDTLALYFHLRHAAERGSETYIHVPMNREADANVVVHKLDDSTYSADPFPFKGDSVTFTCNGRYMAPISIGREPPDLGAALRALPDDRHAVHFVAA
jgi:hypothetical protein